MHLPDEATASAHCKIVVPARYGSSRLPGKPLLPIGGKPMIVHVCQRALEAGCGEVVVATDDRRIAEATAGLGVRAVMTRADHASGTERIAEVADSLAWDDDETVINLQGDEPAMPAELIRELATALHREPLAQIATVAVPISDPAEIFNPNVVKVISDRSGYALYFSRAPIPFWRNGFSDSQPQSVPAANWFRHVGIYGYRAGFIRRYVATEPCQLESLESLEQLRILFMGEKIRVITTASMPPAGVDTAEDLARLRAQFGDR